MIKVLNLLAEDEVFQQRRPSHTSLQAALVLNRTPNIRRQEALAVVHRGFGNAVELVPGFCACLQRPRIGKGTTRGACKAQKRAHWEQGVGETHLGFYTPRHSSWWLGLTKGCIPGT